MDRMDDRDRPQDESEDPEYEAEAREAREHIPSPEFTPGERTVFDDLRDEPNLDDTVEMRSPLAPPSRREPAPPEVVGEGVGGVGGAVAGAAIGSLAGPVGTVIGGIAGAVGGWWAGRAVADSMTDIRPEDDDAYRSHFESSEPRPADRAYDDVRPAYQVGHLAGSNPDYAGRDFDDIEPDLRCGWTDSLRARHGDWEQVRPYAREGFQRRREREQRLGGTPRTMRPTEAARERLHSDDTGF
jgi:hypothetical protein